jgi:type II secretory pathway pseudopilin PulG
MISYEQRGTRSECFRTDHIGAVARSSPFTRSSLLAPRPALTLIELLVVIIILTTLVSAAIPLMAPTNDDRRIREASRMVNAFITGAQTKAIEIQRPYGVMIKRLSQNTNAEGDPDSAHDDNAVSIELQYVEQPSPFVGFSESSSVMIALDNGATGTIGQVLVRFVRRGNEVAQGSDELPIGWDPDLIPPATIRRGDVIEFNGTRFVFTDDGLGNPNFFDDAGFYKPDSGTPDSTFVAKPVNDTGQVIGPRYDDNGYPIGTQTPSISPFWTEPAKYKILRQPMPTAVEPMQMPDGTAIDLRASGIGTNEYFYVPASSGIANYRDNREPIVIMFAPEGRVSRVRFAYHNSTTNTLELYDQPVVDNILLLVGRRELAPPPAANLDPTLDNSKLPPTNSELYADARDTINWLRGESRWIGIGSQTGRIVTVQNNTRPPSATLSDTRVLGNSPGTEEVRNVQIDIARQLARQMSQLGGR